MIKPKVVTIKVNDGIIKENLPALLAVLFHLAERRMIQIQFNWTNLDTLLKWVSFFCSTG